MKGIIYGKDVDNTGIYKIMYRHQSTGRDNRGFERWSWRTKFYKINSEYDLSCLVGEKVEFELSFIKTEQVAIIKELKSKIRDFKIKKLINE